MVERMISREGRAPVQFMERRKARKSSSSTTECGIELLAIAVASSCNCVLLFCFEKATSSAPPSVFERLVVDETTDDAEDAALTPAASASSSSPAAAALRFSVRISGSCCWKEASKVGWKDAKWLRHAALSLLAEKTNPLHLAAPSSTVQRRRPSGRASRCARRRERRDSGFGGMGAAGARTAHGYG